MHRFVILHVADAELRGRVDPLRLAVLVRLRLEVIENADCPALAHQQVDDVRADEAGASGNECAFLM